MISDLKENMNSDDYKSNDGFEGELSENQFREMTNTNEGKDVANVGTAEVVTTNAEKLMMRTSQCYLYL